MKILVPIIDYWFALLSQSRLLKGSGQTVANEVKPGMSPGPSTPAWIRFQHTGVSCEASAPLARPPRESGSGYFYAKSLTLREQDDWWCSFKATVSVSVCRTFPGRKRWGKLRCISPNSLDSGIGPGWDVGLLLILLHLVWSDCLRDLMQVQHWSPRKAKKGQIIPCEYKNC